MKHHFQPILLCNMIFKSEIENPMRKKNVGCFFFSLDLSIISEADFFVNERFF